MRCAAVTMMFLLATAALLHAADDPTTINLTDASWQTLPGGVWHAVVGPDGRTWYQEMRNNLPADLGLLQKHLEEEFAKPAPIVRDVDLVLFEPQKRVWFYTRALFTLLGYDGNTWVVKPIGPG